MMKRLNYRLDCHFKEFRFCILGPWEEVCVQICVRSEDVTRLLSGRAQPAGERVCRKETTESTGNNSSRKLDQCPKSAHYDSPVITQDDSSGVFSTLKEGLDML